MGVGAPRIAIIGVHGRWNRSLRNGKPGEPAQGVAILDSFRRGRRITRAALSTCSSESR